MNRHVMHIATCICCILIPIIGLLYGLWDNEQPKTGAIGSGQPKYPTLLQWIPIISCFLIGVFNLPLAIKRYKQNKRKQN